MPNKSHKNAVDEHRRELEGKHNFRCKKEFDISRNGLIHQIDLGCFRNNPIINAVGMEIESTKNFNNPQVQSNAEDLKEFKRIFPKSKTFHIHEYDKIDFDKELKLNFRTGI